MSSFLTPFFPLATGAAERHSSVATLDSETVPLSEQIFRVMSYNIRQDDDPEHSWRNRKDAVISILRFHHLDLIGFQEPYPEQIEDLASSLTEFSLVKGAPFQESAHNPIFFRKSRFDLLDTGFFYLSPHPETPHKGWNAKFLRGVSWVKLFDQKSGQTFYFFNTHFDYHSRLARDESAHLLRSKIREIAGPSPFIVAGDFNLFPELGGEETYQILTRKNALAEGRPLVDAQKVSLFPHHGPTGTWSGFKEPGQPGIKPDYIFVDASIEVYFHGILADTFDGQFPSDHLPVVADIAIP